MKSSTFLFIIILLLSSCVSRKPQYRQGASSLNLDTSTLEKSIQHTMYLIGDAGSTKPNESNPVLNYLKNTLENEKANSSIIFLGNNVAEYGIPPAADSANYEKATYSLNQQLSILDKYSGKPIFIPGNHDWRVWGLKGLNRQEKYIEKYLNIKRGKTTKEEWENYFLPDNGCSGVAVSEMEGDVVLLAIDTEWWIRDWNNEPGMNDGCEVKNRAAFRFHFENILRKYRNKKVVIAMHHPMFTYGSHGGHFSGRSHMFPLTDLNPRLYIPLPILGTVAVLYRSTVGSRQDVAHNNYKELKNLVLESAKKNGEFIFASGHENSLQFIERDQQHFIISGTGSAGSPVALGKGSKFASGAKGFSTITFFDGGQAQVRFWEVNQDGTDATLLFQQNINEKDTPSNNLSAATKSHIPDNRDTVHRPIIQKNVTTINAFHRTVLGEHHRPLYKPTYPFPVLDLKTFEDGVVPTKMGGGNQTNSLRLENKEGKEYVLRAMDKDVSRFLPYPFSQITAAKYLIEDNFYSTHPFAPLAIPQLAEAINVYHTNPALYYVPVQPGLGEFNEVFGDAVSLVEERPAGRNWQKAGPSFGYPEKIISTKDLREKLLDNNKHQVDASWLLRSRFLDFMIGDWDRHDDQWTWAVFNQSDGTKLYRPIPRDRDQAFSKYDGLVVGLARTTLPFMRQLQVYGPTIYNYKWNTWSARILDRSFLTELDWPEWEEQVKFVQKNLTDTVIASALQAWPAKVREISAEHITQSIQKRRDDLMTIARKHYNLINQRVDIGGTEEREQFVVDRLDRLRTMVRGYEISKSGKQKQLTYYRVFNNKITDVINIYGNGEEDEFIIKGNVHRGPKVRLIGGMGNDLFIDSSWGAGGRKKTLVYDDLAGNTIIGGRFMKDKRSSFYRFNIYDHRNYDAEYNILIPLPLIGANPDDGLLLGAGFKGMRYNFKKEPYASQHLVGVSYAFATQAFKIYYTGDFTSVFRNLDFYLDLHYKGPSFSFNYAGPGNDSKRPIENPSYYRVRQSELFVFPAIKKRISNKSMLAAGPFFSTSRIEDTKGRYITSGTTNLPADIFENKYYGGARVIFNFNSVDNNINPHTGLRFYSSFSYINNLRNKKEFSTWMNRFSFYKPIDRNETIILASQFGMGINIGNGFEFFQMPTIGGNQGLRGFRNERFYGKSSYWQSTDVRIRFGNSQNKTLPFTIGMFGSFDYGRVWLKQEISGTNKWHYTYGGGIWLSPVDLIVVSLGTFVPGGNTNEKALVLLRMGFEF